MPHNAKGPSSPCILNYLLLPSYMIDCLDECIDNPIVYDTVIWSIRYDIFSIGCQYSLSISPLKAPPSQLFPRDFLPP
jgi:hypothetical protein